MERRMRPRVTPLEKTIAYVNGSTYPAKVIDYSATGIGVVMVKEDLTEGSKVNVDLVVNEELCACCIPGTVCWTCGSAVGIQLNSTCENQVQRTHQLESRLMCGV